MTILKQKNVAGSKKLLEAGRRTIPYLVVYAPDGREVFSSDAYTVDQLVRALGEAQFSSFKLQAPSARETSNDL
jgi:hypothetical protein